MIDRRTFLSGFAAAGTLAGLSGCMTQPTEAHKGANAVPVSWVRYRIGKAGAIDPMLIDNEAGRVVVSQLFDPLLRFDFASGELTPRVATSYQVAEDARSVTFSLAEGVTFHNGDPVTSVSFKRAWERLVRPQPGAEVEGSSDDAVGEDGAYALHNPLTHLLELVDGYEALHRGGASELVGVRCPDDQTLVVELTEPDAEWVYTVAHPALSPVPQRAEDDPETFANNPIGNGPFKMKRAWDGKEEVRLTAYADYAFGKASVEGALLTMEDDTQAAYRQFEAGNVDVCDVPVDQYKNVLDTFGAAEDSCTMTLGAGVARCDEPTLVYLMCNTQVAPLDNAALRTALSYAIDREALADKTLKGSAVPATSPAPPCVARGEIPAWPACSYDPDYAAELFEQAYSAEPDEKRDISLTLLYRKGGVQEYVAEQIKEDLAVVGITLKLQALEAGELVQRYYEGDFECALATWAPTRPTPLAFVEPLLEGERDSLPEINDVEEGQSIAASSLNEEGQPAVTSLFDQARATTDASARHDLCAQALQLASERMAVIPLVHPVHTKIASERIGRLAVDANALPDLAHAQK